MAQISKAVPTAMNFHLWRLQNGGCQVSTAVAVKQVMKYLIGIDKDFAQYVAEMGAYFLSIDETYEEFLAMKGSKVLVEKVVVPAKNDVLLVDVEGQFDAVYRVHKDDVNEEVESKDFKKVNATWGRHGEMSLVELEEATNRKCGMHMGLEGCLNAKGHANSLIAGQSGKVYVRILTNHCDRPTCKVCYQYGWASREARKAEKRLKFASIRFGKIEHIILSPSSALYGLSYEELHKRALKAAERRGIIGGAMIWHAFRYHGFREWQRLNTSDESLHWFFSPHFHLLSFLKESYDRCRHCPDYIMFGKSDCGCKRAEYCCGFEQTTRRCWSGTDGVNGDNFICKIEGERKTIVGSLFYQLGHSSVRTGKKRFYPLTYFGVASYHKLHYKPEKDKRCCPICGLELIKIRYLGDMSICKDEGSPNFHRHLFMDMDEGMGDVFVKRGDNDG
jgi:hypothetical protein